MPYIEKDRRTATLSVGAHAAQAADSVGELNYAICCLVNGYLGKNPNYQRYNDAIGALECAKLEIYRRRVVPYENMKRERNGDVF